MKPLLYIAGPYSTGDQVANARRAMAWGKYFWLHGGAVPFVPHLSIAWHLAMPEPLKFWYEYDLAILRHCHALFRMGGESVGADAEVREARRLGLPVFEDDALLCLRWCREWQERHLAVREAE